MFVDVFLGAGGGHSYVSTDIFVPLNIFMRADVFFLL